MSTETVNDNVVEEVVYAAKEDVVYAAKEDVDMSFLNDDGSVTVLGPDLEFVDVPEDDLESWGMASAEHGYGMGVTIDFDVAKQLLGWVDNISDANIKRATCDLALRIPHPEKPEKQMTVYVNLMRNPKNRPFRKSLADDYAQAILRKEWKHNGESIIFGTNQVILGGQHRLAAVVLAEYERQGNESRWGTEPVSIVSHVTSGIDPASQDTTDIGQKRTYGDVLFQRAEFDGSKYNEKEAKKLSTDLGSAARLVWLRSSGCIVQDAKKLHNPVLLRFIDNHKKLKDATEVIFELDINEEGKGLITSHSVSRAYAAGLLYLMAASFTEDTDDINYENWDTAVEFWTNFAAVEAKGVFARCRTTLSAAAATKRFSRDQLTALLIKTYRYWVNDETPKKVDLTKSEMENPGDMRIGGIDMVRIDD